MPTAKFIFEPIRPGCMFGAEGDLHRVWGFGYDMALPLPKDSSYFGFVHTGEVELQYEKRLVTLVNRHCYFAVKGPATLRTMGQGFAVGIREYQAMNKCGGPIEPEGRFPYLNGCSASMLIEPVRKGDPCFNFLHVPPHLDQGPKLHHHPAVRIGLICGGSGRAFVRNGSEIAEFQLSAGKVFVLPKGLNHKFRTESEHLDIITFHPDSAYGMTNKHHQMLDQTIMEDAEHPFVAAS